ncbi:acetate/propionate family kinase [Hydrogenimonas sp.]
MKILVLNAGSSSLKYAFFGGGRRLGGGVVERIGEKGGPKDHHEALGIAEKGLAKGALLNSFDELDAAGHRVVHGGERFTRPVRIDDAVIDAIRAVVPLAPLHNPANLEGIESMAAKVPSLPQVAVFDTAFHQTMAPEAYLYAIPRELYERYGIRRYGFHGTSHLHVAKRAAPILGRPLERLNLITLHLGNGASVCAIRNGRSIETSMGFTPLEGLVMGTRCGDLDPEIPLFLQRNGVDAEAVLNRRSGLKGLCGENDMRRIETMAESGDRRAREAMAIFARRVRKYIGAYSALLDGVDALVFTAGIGEHSARIRQMACRGLEHLGIELDEGRNEKGEETISTDRSRVGVLVLPTDEELEIARQTEAVLSRSRL